MRVPQPGNGRGSLKWIQRLATKDAQTLADALGGEGVLRRGRLTWLSPLESDDWAEYRDGCFLDRIGYGQHSPALREFWPSRGPQWDGLARFEDGTVCLVEAKANVLELKSKCAASPRSRMRIDRALAATASSLGAAVTSAWIDNYYQYANRLAHLHFLRAQSVPTLLLFVYFTGDAAVAGPASAEEWQPALGRLYRSLGVPDRVPGVVSAFVSTSALS